MPCGVCGISGVRSFCQDDVNLALEERAGEFDTCSRSSHYHMLNLILDTFSWQMNEGKSIINMLCVYKVCM